MQSFAADETAVLTQIGFLGSVLFLTLYTYWYNWWQNAHGIVLSTLALTFAVRLLHPVLIYWHLVHHSPLSDETWEWVSTQGLLGPLAWLVLSVQLIRRNHASLMRGLRNPASVLTAWPRRIREADEQDMDPWDPRITPMHHSTPPE